MVNGSFIVLGIEQSSIERRNARHTNIAHIVSDDVINSIMHASAHIVYRTSCIWRIAPDILIKLIHGVLGRLFQVTNTLGINKTFFVVISHIVSSLGSLS